MKHQLLTPQEGKGTRQMTAADKAEGNPTFSTNPKIVPVGLTPTPIDNLSSHFMGSCRDTKGDIAFILQDRVDYLNRAWDADDVFHNLFELVDPPKVLVGYLPTEEVYASYNRTLSEAAVSKYVGMLKDPNFEFDPIIVVNGKFLEGGHRMEAYHRAGRDLIPVVDIANLMEAAPETWEKWMNGENIQASEAFPISKTAAEGFKLKLKTKPDKTSLDQFMDDFWSQTTGNPFNDRERVWGNSAGIECSPFDGKIHLSAIRSFEDKTGHGSPALKWLCGLADKHGVAIALDPVPFGDKDKGLDKQSLKDWYLRNGFVEGECGLIRQSKGSKTASGTTPSKMYHYTSAENRKGILAEGLVKEKSDVYLNGGWGAIYLAEELRAADPGCDIWEVNVDGLELEPDLTTDISDDPSWANDKWWETYDNIPPERLKLIHQTKTANRAAGTINGEDVLQYLMKLNKWSKETALQVLGVDGYGSDYTLQDFPLSRLKAGDDWNPELSKEYAARTTPFPPIILGYEFNWTTRKQKLVIKDGNHRVDAAKKRGDKTIKAYVPIDDGEETELKESSPGVPAGGGNNPVVAARRPKYPSYTLDNRTFSDKFLNWFNGSKVVDSYGKPLIVWHGSPDLRWLKDSGIFKSKKEELIGVKEDPERAFFFAGDPATALSYADDHRAWDYQNAEPGTQGFYLCLKNPMIVDNKSRKWHGTDTTVADAKKAGHDGVIIHNTIDNYQVEGHKVTDVFIAFEPNQIKAVKGNSGEFDPNNPSVFASAEPKMAAVKSEASAKPLTETSTFQQWFSGSKVVDSQGNPLLMYHGTSEPFTKVDLRKSTQGLFWTISNIEELKAGVSGANSTKTILPCYVSLKNPAGWDEYEKKSIAELKNEGYDGLLLPDGEGFTAVAFKANQVKIVPQEKTAAVPEIKLDDVAAAIDTAIIKIREPKSGYSAFEYLRDYLLGCDIRLQWTDANPAISGGQGTTVRLADYITTAGFEPFPRSGIPKVLVEFADGFQDEIEKRKHQSVGELKELKDRILTLVTHERVHDYQNEQMTESFKLKNKDNPHLVPHQIVDVYEKDRKFNYLARPSEVGAYAVHAVYELRKSGLSDQDILKHLRTYKSYRSRTLLSGSSVAFLKYTNMDEYVQKKRNNPGDVDPEFLNRDVFREFVQKMVQYINSTTKTAANEIDKTAKTSDDIAKVQAIIQEYMQYITQGLPVPRVKVANNLNSKYLATCAWTSLDPDNTLITVQKSILNDDKTLRRCIAHEMAHVDWFLTYRRYLDWRTQKEQIRDEHGEEWLKRAEVFNKALGEGFVTATSDESYVKEENTKEFYVLVMNMPKFGRLFFCVSAKLSPAQRKVVDLNLAIGNEYCRLFKTLDISFLEGKQIGKGWSSFNNSEDNEKLNKLWAEGTPVELPPFKETAPDPNREFFVALAERYGRSMGWFAYSISLTPRQKVWLQRSLTTPWKVVKTNNRKFMTKQIGHGWDAAAPDTALLEQWDKLWDTAPVVLSGNLGTGVEKNASPDFGYTKYNDREDDLSKLQWTTKDSDLGGYTIEVSTSDGQEIAYIGIALVAAKPDVVWVASSGFNDEDDPQWRGTGLGQQLYDKAIAEAKKRGYKRFYAGAWTTDDARKAWDRLARRYPVLYEERKGTTKLRKLPYIDLTKMDKTAAPISEGMKSQIYYHGTGSETAAQAILKDGIQPRDISMPDKAKSRSQLAPVPDRVYVTTSKDYAAIYALGGQMFGTSKEGDPMPNFLQNRLAEGQYGYIFEIHGSQLTGDVVPDEDSIGEALYWLASDIKDSQRLKSLENGEKERWDGELDGLLRSMEIIKQQPINQPDVPESVRTELYHLYLHNTTDRQKQNLLEVGTQAQVGKKLQKILSQETCQWMIENGAHVAHRGPIFPTHCQRFSKEKALYTTTLADILEEVPIQKTASNMTADRDFIAVPWEIEQGEAFGTVVFNPEYLEQELANSFGFDEDKAKQVVESFNGDPVALLYTLEVYPKYQGKGWGTKLLNWFEQEVKSYGARAIMLSAVARPNEPGLSPDKLNKWYEDNGYRKMSEQQDGESPVFVKQAGEGDGVWAKKFSAVGESETLPPPPGKSPIPAGTIRCFHYTHSPDNVPSILQQGLLKSKGRGDDLSGSGPSAGIWASTEAPKSYALQNHVYIEFYAYPEQVSGNAQHWMRGDDPVAWSLSGDKHIIMGVDVPPEQIVAVHEPWHTHAQYMLDMTDAEWEEATWLHDPEEVERLEHKYHSPSEAKALAYVQKLKGISKTASAASRHSRFEIWIHYQGLGVRTGTNHYHSDLLREAGWKVNGQMYDKVDRGTAYLNPDTKTIKLYGYNSDVVPEEVLRHYESEYPDYEVSAPQSKSATSISPQAIGRAVEAFCKSNKSYEILDSIPGLSGCTWTAGGCWVLAAAVHQAFGGEVYGIYSAGSKKQSLLEKREPHIQHVLVKFGDIYIDADGASSESALLQRWAKLELVFEPTLAPFDPATTGAEIPSPSNTEEIIAGIQSYLKPGGKTAASDEEEKAQALKHPDADSYLNEHCTGWIQPEAYSSPGMFNWQKLEMYPVFLKTITLKDGRKVDLRQEGRKNEYTKMVTVTENNTAGYPVERQTHARDENGDLIYLTDEEINAKGYPLYDTAIFAFNDKDECVGQASDEWGADLVAVRPDYQKKGLGTILLTEFRRQFKKYRQMGQMTDAGRALTKNYYKSLVGKLCKDCGGAGKTGATKTAAPRKLMYHGSPIRNLRPILAQGLIPMEKGKNWQEDPDASFYVPSRESYGGTYFSTNLQTAMSSPRDKYKEGRFVLVIAELQPNTFFLDEDNIISSLNVPLAENLNSSDYHVGIYYLVSTFPDAPTAYRESLENMRTQFVENTIRNIELKMNHFREEGITLHEGLKSRLTTLLRDEVFNASLARKAAHIAEGSKTSNYELMRIQRVVFPPKIDSNGEWSEEKPVQWPSVSEAEANFKAAAEKVTRALRVMAVPQGGWNDTARVPTPVGYSGSNKILAVLEIRDGVKYRKSESGKGSNPVQIVKHYGKTIPEDFFRQFKERVGSDYVVLEPGEEPPPPKNTDEPAAEVTPDPKTHELVGDTAGWKTSAKTADARNFEFYDREQELNDKEYEELQKDYPERELTDLELVNKYVGYASSLSEVELVRLGDLVKNSTCSTPRIIRVEGRKVIAKQGQIVDFKMPLSFTKKVAPVLSGRAPAACAFKYDSETLLMINNPTRGLEIDYSKLKLFNYAHNEAEVLIAGKYRVVKIVKAVRPGTLPKMNYKGDGYDVNYTQFVPLVILEEA